MELDYESKRPLYIPYAGPILLEFPLLNKGSAFSIEERNEFNLNGLLPEAVESIEEQAQRAWRQFQDFKNNNDKHVYLRNIQDTNETLFYRLLDNHLEEMMPIIYTPTSAQPANTSLKSTVVRVACSSPTLTATISKICCKTPPSRM